MYKNKYLLIHLLTSFRPYREITHNQRNEHFIKLFFKINSSSKTTKATCFARFRENLSMTAILFVNLTVNFLKSLPALTK